MRLKIDLKTFALSLTLLTLTSCSIFSQTFEGEKGPLAENTEDSKKINREMLLREEITEHAREYLGHQYRSAGKSPDGFDCSGFVYYIMKDFDIKLAGSSATQELQGRKITRQEAQPGDLVFFRRKKGGRVFHVAMVLENKNGNLTIIHSTSGRGVVIDKINDSTYWRSKIMTFRNVLAP